MRRFPVIASLVLLACADSGTPGVTRETMPNGRVLVTYAAGLGTHEDTIQTDLRIGQLDGPAEEMFGDIRGVEMDDQGRVYILDFQASEIRTFSPEGSYIATIARKGEGPGELSAANGLAFDAHGRLWVNDHGKRSVLVLDQAGTELARHPGIVPGYGYLWNAVIDSAGLIWQAWSHPVTPRSSSRGFTGLVESANRGYFKSFDPVTGTYDSLPTGTATYRGYAASYEGGGWSMGIPFDGGTLIALDRHRRAWLAISDTYTLFRLGERGDTTMEVRVTESPVPVTPEDITSWRAGSADFTERVPGALDEIEKLIPPVKPFIDGIHSDEHNRLWIARPVPTGEAPRYDVFSPNAEYLGSVRLVAGARRGRAPLIRGTRILMVVAGEDGDQAVVIGQLPGFLRQP
jgi:hypothetical protein